MLWKNSSGRSQAALAMGVRRDEALEEKDKEITNMLDNFIRPLNEE